MGIQSALYSGVSGLNTNSQAMSVIGNNLANTNTLGFKGSRSIFSDLLSSNVFGSGGTSQVGRGVGLSIVDSIYSQGTFETTSSDTDVAIEGVGFFVLKEAGNDTAYYSRAGAFRFDDEGYLVNPEGFRVQGKLFDPTNNSTLLPMDPTDIQVANVGLIEANPTSELTFTTNLDENSTVISSATPIDPNNNATYNYSASSQIFDSLGESHLITVYWRLVNDATNTWEAAYTIDNDAATITAITDFDASTAGNQAMSFDNIGKAPDTNGDGVPDPFTTTVGPITWANGAATSTIELSFDCTQYDSDSIVIGQQQNGYAAGELTNVSINSEGVVVASYSNGRQINISQLVLAKFQNPGGLKLAGANRYIAPAEAGTIRVGLPGPELGKLFTNSLEQSNVDMGQEFVKMITTQRGFQANSKIITTVDEMLSELINLKR
ncbi:flagellar hook-basal body protein [Desulfobulbus propionicus DSM 2032]|uniref:Flagellar hook protein FlgE n=1 Tax=Desulfobulbus propionicus (strain ATCC 33891 / DSM 2032 / VKM B-1956 / 1pr3) TaxID=577650 RepID=A0A7U3YMZ6_DESPD|nr:flagellar hook protein FlgE [Desulfobulbus propionicus]ADW18373.1 flagellar hook-basal body protein [Desulfobulbus propionicus DSM 2032]